MWQKSENSESLKPLEQELSGERIILRRSFKQIPQSEERGEHWEFETVEMSLEQYEIYKMFDEQVSEQADALIELAEIIAGE